MRGCTVLRRARTARNESGETLGCRVSTVSCSGGVKAIPVSDQMEAEVEEAAIEQPPGTNDR